jgi:predicted oxidoreductase
MTLVYGCMGLGGDWSGTPPTGADIDVAERAVDAALEIGITWFDQADIYRGGGSETALGQVLRRRPGLRDRIKIQTKCGIRLGEDGLDAYYDLSAAAIAERVDASLARLGVDHVEILLLHRPDPLLEPDEVAAAYAGLRAAGKVGALGVSNMSAAQMAFLQRALDEPLVVNQLEMSLFRRDWVEAGVLVNHPQADAVAFPEGTVEYCRTHAVRLQAWGALAQGRYSGASGAEPAAELVASMAAEKGTTPEAIVLAGSCATPPASSPSSAR